MIRTASILTVLVAGLAAVVCQAAAAGTAPEGLEAMFARAATATWPQTTVDDTRDVGTSVGVAIEPGTGFPYVSYYDTGSSDLWFARFVGHGGNCGDSGSWQCQMIASSGDVGSYNSIAVRAGGDSTEVVIAFYDATTYSLRYASGLCDAAGCAWTLNTISSGVASLLMVGRYNSVAYDSHGSPYIAYQTVSTVGDESVQVAHFLVDGGGNCGVGSMAGSWQCDTIMSGPGLGTYASIVVTSTNFPRVAFFDPVAGRPYVAVRLGNTSGNCGPENRWLCRSPFTIIRESGQSVSLYLDHMEATRLAFLDTTTPDHMQVVYATYVGLNGNCGYSDDSSHYEWQCDVIADDVGNVGSGRTVAIVGDADGRPMIAYRDASSDLGPPILKLARPYSAVPDASTNCGPYINPVHMWYCAPLDIGGSNQQEAAGLAFARGVDGVAVAYHELNTYVYPEVGNLKVMNEAPLVFKDGFETGDTTQWQ